MRLGHRVVHEWEWQSALPSAPGCGREGRGPTEQRDTHDTWLKKKNPTIVGGGGAEGRRDWGMCLERNSETDGHNEETSISLEASRRGSLRRGGNTSYLLSPRSRVLSFMRAVRAYPLVAGRDMWD